MEVIKKMLGSHYTEAEVAIVLAERGAVWDFLILTVKIIINFNFMYLQ